MPEIIRKFREADYHYDNIESHDGYIRFFYAGGSIYFLDWNDAEEWIDNVIFD